MSEGRLETQANRFGFQLAAGFLLLTLITEAVFTASGGRAGLPAVVFVRSLLTVALYRGHVWAASMSMLLCGIGGAFTVDALLRVEVDTGVGQYLTTVLVLFVATFGSLVAELVAGDR